MGEITDPKDYLKKLLGKEFIKFFPYTVTSIKLAEKVTLEEVINKIKPGEATVVRKPINLGISEEVYIVLNTGMDLIIHELKKQ